MFHTTNTKPPKRKSFTQYIIYADCECSVFLGFLQNNSPRSFYEAYLEACRAYPQLRDEITLVELDSGISI